MKRNTLVAVSIGVAVVISGCSVSGGSMPVQNVVTVQSAAPNSDQALSLAGFGERLFAQLQLEDTPNPVISPLSIFYALAMADEGARGETAEAFEKVFGMPVDQARQVAAYMLDELSNPDAGTTVNVANSAWLDDSFTVEQAWVDMISAYYEATVYNTDLQAKGAVDLVNQWISEKTNKLIPRMLEQINPDTVALLINAIYLKADWAAPFDPNDTFDREFVNGDGASAFVPFMSSDPMTRQVIDTAGAEGVVLPYADGRLAFVAAMPKSGTFSLDGTVVPGLLAAAQQHDDVMVAMPKFHTEYGAADLIPALTELGLGVAFDPAAADFGGMAPNLYISAVLHKVSMSVGEEGTEAAAATVVAMDESGGAFIEPIIVVFNRPYLYAVVDTVSGVPLFIGWMEDPSLAPPAS